MDMIFGFYSKLTVEVDGELVDVTDAIKIIDGPPASIGIDMDSLLFQVRVHRAAKKRVDAERA